MAVFSLLEPCLAALRGQAHRAAASSWIARPRSSFCSAATTGADLQGSVTTCLSGSRAVLLIEGPHTIPFLQGMTTNDMRPLDAPGAAPVYAALLTPKGKFLHDCIFYKLSREQQGGPLLMEVDVSGKQRALDWLVRHKLRKQVKVADVSDEHAVWVRFGQQAATHAQQQQPQSAPGAEANGAWWPDPRLPALGSRCVRPAAGDGGAPAAGASEADARLRLYRQWRYMHGVAEGEVEIPTDKAAPLDFNLDELRGISYRKGCYVGQERNSFTHYRGIIRKRCMPFTYPPGAGAPSVGEAVLGPEGESVGTVQGAEGGYGLAYVRLRPALLAAGGEGAAPLSGKQRGAALRPFRPPWWPEAWGHEEDAAGAGAEASPAAEGVPAAAPS